MSAGGFSIDQLMELAGLSISQAGMIELRDYVVVNALKLTPLDQSTKSTHLPKAGKYWLLVGREIMVCVTLSDLFVCIFVPPNYLFLSLPTLSPSFSYVVSHCCPGDWSFLPSLFGPSSATKKRASNFPCHSPTILGGDGLVCARHLHHYGYMPTVYYPKPSSPQLFQNLTTQLRALQIPFTNDFPTASRFNSFIVDALFGFSFKGPVRAPFETVIPFLINPPNGATVLSVDVPSSWDVEEGPVSGDGEDVFMPAYLVSLTAPKPCIKHYKGTHFLGGRFVPPEIAEKYDFEVPKYPGIDQVVEVPVEGDEGGKL